RKQAAEGLTTNQRLVSSLSGPLVWADKSLSPELPRCRSQAGCCANTSTVPVHIVAATFATDRGVDRRECTCASRETRFLIREPNDGQLAKRAADAGAWQSADTLASARSWRHVLESANPARNRRDPPRSGPTTTGSPPVNLCCCQLR